MDTRSVVRRAAAALGFVTGLFVVESVQRAYEAYEAEKRTGIIEVSRLRPDGSTVTRRYRAVAL